MADSMNRARMEAEANLLQMGAEILARSIFADGGASADVLRLEQAFEVLLRKEAERTMRELRGRKTLADLFPDVEPAK
jgi:hypothetical protein